MRMRWMFTGALALTLGLGGCSESQDATDDSGAGPTDTGAARTDTGPAVTDTGPAVTDAGAAGDVPSAVDAGGATGRVVINELRATGGDWVELYNPGTAPVDLGGYILADTDTMADGGAPRLAEATTFPAGTTLAPRAHLLVVVDLTDAGVGVQTGCLMGQAAQCLHGRFGISAGNGETVYLLDPTMRVVDAAQYPPNAAPTDRTWGRVPDGTGAFVVTRPTPAAPNATP